MTKVNTKGACGANNSANSHSANNGAHTHNSTNGASNGHPTNATLAAAIEAAELGFSVVAINPKTKRPFGPWEHAQAEAATPGEVAQLKKLKAFAIVGGAVSGGSDANGNPLFQTTLDFDVSGFYEEWRAETGDLSDGLPVQRTGGGGYQVLFKSPIPIRNEKLAYAPNAKEEAGREIAIETRGEGGYFVVAPSLHPSGNYYQWRESDLNGVPVITKARAQALLDTGKRLDRAPFTKKQLEEQEKRAREAKSKTHKANPAGVSVIDAFNGARSIEETLERFGYARRGDRFSRPGGTDPSVAILDGKSFHHASNDPLNDNHTHTPFSVFCVLEHGDDVKAAVKAAAVELGLSSAYRSATPGEVPPRHAEGDPRPVIDAGNADAKSFGPQCWGALLKASETPRLFKIGGAVVRLESGNGEPQLRELDEAKLIFELARAAVFTKTKKRGDEYIETVVHPPRDYARDLLADDRPPLPRLSRIVQAPVFSACGDLQTEPGYHSKSQTFFHAGAGLNVPEVSDAPTDEEIELAKSWIFQPLRDFPFVSDADRANAIGFALTSFVRDLIDGPTPLGGVEASTPGTGKGLLCDVMLYPSLGRNAGTLTLGKDENDTKNRITAVLQSGKAAVLLDNVTHKIDSGALASVLTSLEWEDRKFITHEIRSYPVRCVWLMAANNPTMSTEIARRYVRIRLNAAIEQPWQRDGFAIGDLRLWMKENRSQMIWAYLTLVRAWQRAGAPRGGLRLGSYESWAAIVGGILDNAGIEGFLTNLQQFYADADTEGAAWREFVAAWFEMFNADKVKTAQLFEIAQNIDGLGYHGKTESAEKKSLGMMLRAKRDTVISNFAIISAGTDRKGVSLWMLSRLEPQKVPGPAGTCWDFSGNF